MLSLRVGFVSLIAPVLLLGCAEKGPERGVVKGRVTFNGKGATGVTVFFENAESGVAINAPVDTNGNYEVKSYQGAGLPVGSYRVAVMPGGVMTAEEASPKATEAKAARAAAAVTPIPERYHKTATSHLTVDVKAGENPPFDFSLTP